jgi:hypothetical protein
MVKTYLARRVLPLAILLVALCAATEGAAQGAASEPAVAATAGTTAIVLSSKGTATRSLRAAGVQISAVRPATRRGGELRLPVARVDGLRARQDGALKLRAGRRSLTIAGLEATLGRSPRITARLRGTRVAVFAVTPATPVRLAPLGVTRARLSLTRTGAAVIRRALRLRRLSAGALGSVTIVTVAAGSPAPAPGPAPVPAPGPAPAPQPGPPGEEPIDAIGAIDWTASELPGSSDLKSFIDYVYMNWPGPGPAGPGQVVASGGAARIDPGNRYDYRLSVTAVATETGGRVVIENRGRLAYQLPAHWIDNRVYDPVIELDGAAGRLVASGQYGNRSDPTAPPITYADEHLLDLDLTGIAPETDGTTRTWRHVPAVVSPDGEDELGYPPGRPWGFFTITVPA